MERLTQKRSTNETGTKPYPKIILDLYNPTSLRLSQTRRLHRHTSHESTPVLLQSGVSQLPRRRLRRSGSFAGSG